MFEPFKFISIIEKGNLNALKEYQEKHSKLPVNVNLSYACGATFIYPLPLITTFIKGYYDMAKYLIVNGASLDVICKKHQKTPRDFLPKDLKEKDKVDIQKEFFDAIKKGNINDVKIFLNNHPNFPLNENISLYDDSENMYLLPLPLIVALENNQKDIANILISNGASLDAWCKKTDKYVKDIKREN